MRLLLIGLGALPASTRNSIRPLGRLGQLRKVKVQPVEWLPQDVFVLDRESLLSGIEPALNVLTSVSDVDRNLRPRHNALSRRIP